MADNGGRQNNWQYRFNNTFNYNFKKFKRMDINPLILQSELSREEIAKIIFPLNAHPEKALSRLIKNPKTMSVEQLIRLSKVVLIEPTELISGYKAKFAKNTHIFTSQGCTIFLNTVTWITTIIPNNSEEIVEAIGGPGMTISNYFENVNNILSKF